MRRRSSLQLNSDLNLTNLIDVIFSILVVFMITAPLMSQGVKVDLPKTQSASLDEVKSIRITVTRQREVIINETPSDAQNFRNDFRQLWQGDEETVVVVNSDESVPYGFVMKLIAEAQLEGAKRLGFLTDPAAAASPSQRKKR